MLPAQLLTDIVSSYNKTLNDIREANENLYYVTPIRVRNDLLEHRHECLHQLMNHRSHQAEY